MMNFLIYVGIVAGIAFLVLFVVLWIASYQNAKQLEQKGLKREKVVRKRTRTYKDMFGKYTVNIKDEEWVTVPKEEKK